MADKFVLDNPSLPAVPNARVKDPTLQRVHDALKEVVETMRGTRGSGLDRAVFIRDLVATGLLKFNGNGNVSVGDAITGGDDGTTTDGSIPPALQNIVATAGFTYILLTWNDPQYRRLAYYEIWRRQVVDPSSSAGYVADDARITLSEQSEITTLLAQSIKTPQEVRTLAALTALDESTLDYDNAKTASLLYPTNTVLASAYAAAGTALKSTRLDEQTARYDSSASGQLVGVTTAPVWSDAVDRGTTYLYWVRAVSTAGIFGPFNPNGVAATTQPDISGIIDELTDEINRGPLTDYIFNGLDVPGQPGISLLEILASIEASADQARSDASDALSAVVSTIPPSIWQAIHDLYNMLASTVLRTVISGYGDRVDVATLTDRVATAETTLLNQADDVAALSGEIVSYSTQFDTQFARVDSAVLALSDADSAFAMSLDVLEGAVYDPELGTIKAHARIDDVLNLDVTADSVLAQKFSLLAGKIDNADGQIADILTLQLSPTSALAAKLTDIDLTFGDITGSLSDLLSLSITPNSALAQKLTALDLSLGNTNGAVKDILNLQIGSDSLLAQSLRSLEGQVASASGSVNDLLSLKISPSSVLAIKFTELSGQVNDASGAIRDILDLNVSPTTVLATRLTDLEGQVATTDGRVSDILSLNVTEDNVLVGKLTELEASTDYASGVVQDMIGLRLTSTDLANTAFAGALTRYETALGGLDSSVEAAIYNEIAQLKDADGNLSDPVARAQWGVRIEQAVNGQTYVSGFGLNQTVYADADGTHGFSEFIVAADRFAIIDPDNPDTSKNSPFIVAADPDTGEMKVWIRTAMISKASIQELIAGSIIADYVRAGAFVQTGYLATPVINVGTWTQTVAGDVTSWVYNPASGRQGNFSVDSSGILHANSAYMKGLRIEDNSGGLILDAGLGAYSSAIANSAIGLSSGGTLTGAGGGTVTIAGLGYSGDLNATKNTITRSAAAPASPTNGDIWIESDVDPDIVWVRVAGAWVASANYLTAGTQLTDYDALSNANITLNSDGSLAGGGGGTVAPFEPYHAAMWDFRGTASGWAAGNGTLLAQADNIRLTTSVSTPTITKTAGISISGALFNKVRIKYRRTAGTSAGWGFNLYWGTLSHVINGSYYNSTFFPESPLVNNKWYISEIDMTSVTAGAADWISSTINALSFEFSSGGGDVWEIDWIIVGRHGAGEWVANTLNPSNPLTAANIGTYIQNLAVGTLHIAGNAVTVPSAAVNSTTQFLTGMSNWVNVCAVTVTIPATGLSEIDTAIPILINWAVEAAVQVSGAQVRQWRIVKDFTPVIYTSSATILDVQNFISGVTKGTQNAGATVTWTLQGKGVAALPIYQTSMWAMAVRR